MSFIDSLTGKIESFGGGFSQVTDSVGDSLSNVVGSWMQIESAKRGFELHDAAFQQERTQNAISVDQQTRQQNLDVAASVERQQSEAQSNLMAYAPWVLGGVVVLAVVLKVAR